MCVYAARVIIATARGIHFAQPSLGIGEKLFYRRKTL